MTQPRLPLFGLKDIKEFMRMVPLSPDPAMSAWPRWETTPRSVAEHTDWCSIYLPKMEDLPPEVIEMNAEIERFHRAEYAKIKQPVLFDEYAFADGDMAALVSLEIADMMNAYEEACITHLYPSHLPANPIIFQTGTNLADDLYGFAQSAMFTSQPGIGKTHAMLGDLHAIPTANRHERRSALSKRNRRGKRHEQHDDIDQSMGLLRARHRGQHEHTRRASYQPGDPPR